MIGVAFFVIAIVVIAIWIVIELKRLRHKIFAIFLIFLVLASYISVTYVFRGQNIDFKTIPGIISAAKIYFSWLGSIFTNMKTITASAIKLDWAAANKTIG